MVVISGIASFRDWVPAVGTTIYQAGFAGQYMWNTERETFAGVLTYYSLPKVVTFGSPCRAFLPNL